MLTKKDFPSATALKELIVRALRKLGGEGTNEQLADEVACELNLSADDLSLKHNAARGQRSEFEYRMALARTRLKDAGQIEKRGPKRWAVRKK